MYATFALHNLPLLLLISLLLLLLLLRASNEMKIKSCVSTSIKASLTHTHTRRICFVAVCSVSVSLAPLGEEVLPTQLASLLASPCSSNFASHFPFSQKFFPFQLHSCFSFSSYCCCSSFATHTHIQTDRYLASCWCCWFFCFQFVRRSSLRFCLVCYFCCPRASIFSNNNNCCCSCCCLSS